MLNDCCAAGSKKISSEEETYSDLSVLIFYHNFKGIQSQYEPFAPLVQAANASVAQVAMRLSCFCWATSLNFTLKALKLKT